MHYGFIKLPAQRPKYCRAIKKNILAWYYGLKPQPPPACFVTSQGTLWTEKGVLGAPALCAGVRHPSVVVPTAIDEVLWQIL
jgi:hypothetical protein